MLTNPLDKNNWWKKYQRRVDSEGLEDKGGDEEEREQVQEEEEEEEEEHLEDDEAPGAFLPFPALAGAVFVPPPPWLRSQEIAPTCLLSTKTLKVYFSGAPLLADIEVTLLSGF